MTVKTTSFVRRAAVASAAIAVAATSLLAGAGDAQAGRLPGGSKTTTGIDGQVVKLTRTDESVVRQASVANNGAGRAAAVSGTYSAKLSKGTGSLTVGYLVGCQVNIDGLKGGLSGSLGLSGASLSGAVSVPLTPGQVAFIKGDSLSLKKGHGTVLVDSFQIEVQQCGGAASARSVVQVLAADGFTAEDGAISGNSGFVQSTLYGKPFSLG